MVSFGKNIQFGEIRQNLKIVEDYIRIIKESQKAGITLSTQQKELYEELKMKFVTIYS